MIMATKKLKVPVILGPTASGKTEISIQVAKKLNGEIISADSMQIYRKMNVGTAKITTEEAQGIPHHLIDCIDPDEEFSVAVYKKLALTKIKDIFLRGKHPLIVGGSGLYINGLTLPWEFDNKYRNEEIRQQLEEEACNFGKEELYNRLRKVDPETAAIVHPNNIKRVIRALEIFEATGISKSELDKKAAFQDLPYDYRLFGLDWQRESLYNRINSRVDLMVLKGLVEETKLLIEQGYSWDLIALKAIGYKELRPFIEGKQTLEEAVLTLKRDTRHFAKRQKTWFRKDKRIQWLIMNEDVDLNELVAEILDSISRDNRI